jgi:hypothetical protein
LVCRLRYSAWCTIPFNLTHTSFDTLSVTLTWQSYSSAQSSCALEKSEYSLVLTQLLSTNQVQCESVKMWKSHNLHWQHLYISMQKEIGVYWNVLVFFGIVYGLMNLQASRRIAGLWLSQLLGGIIFGNSQGVVFKKCLCFKQCSLRTTVGCPWRYRFWTSEAIPYFWWWDTKWSGRHIKRELDVWRVWVMICCKCSPVVGSYIGAIWQLPLLSSLPFAVCIEYKYPIQHLYSIIFHVISQPIEAYMLY